MQLEPNVCYRALESRDARFDGRFFTGVVSTGVFCRPICPAPTPLDRNCRFYASAAAALEAGFRPCLRCSPETSPGAAAWNGTSAVVTRALRLIELGGLNEGTVEDFSERLGVGARQLRRLFGRHLGASPRSVAQAHRLLLAKKLIAETRLPLTDVAFCAGYGSVRRFNESFRDAYSRAPSALRRGATVPTGVVTVKLGFRPPYDWDALIWFLAARAVDGVEQVEPDRYRRTFQIGQAVGTLEVRPRLNQHCLEATIRCSDACVIQPITAQLRRVFDLTADPAAVAACLGRDERLAEMIRIRPGLRVPGGWDGFETAVRAVVGQQVSVRGATTILGRIAEAYGASLDDPSATASLNRMFPTADEMADGVDGIGLTSARARTLRSLARAQIDLHPSVDPAAAVAALESLPGIGPWTAQYTAMRALGDPDAFPPGDLGLERRLGLSRRELSKAAESWRPWRAYAALHLWTPKELVP